nr:unnamed protein product [Callosobruchus analis]
MKRPQNSLLLAPAMPSEVLEIFKCLKKSKSLDVYGLNSDTVKAVMDLLVDPLTNRTNDQILGLLDGAYTYLSDDFVETGDEGEHLNFTIEFLNSINSSGVPQHRLSLKVGTVVMLLRNLNTKKGLCNGNKLVISSMRSNLIEAKVISGSATGEMALIPRIDLISSIPPDEDNVLNQKNSFLGLFISLGKAFSYALNHAFEIAANVLTIVFIEASPILMMDTFNLGHELMNCINDIFTFIVTLDESEIEFYEYL